MNAHPPANSAARRGTARLGHVHIKARDASRTAPFYARLLGLTETERAWNDFIFLSGNDAHHELAIQSLGDDAPGPQEFRVGLYHTAWEVGDARTLDEIWGRLESMSVRVVAVDHGISWALYFNDPDGNGVEVYLDRRAAPGGARTWHGRSSSLDRATLRGL